VNRRISLRWIALAPPVLVAACVSVANGPALIPTYRLADSQTLVLNLQTNPVIWVGVTGVDEKPDAVIVSTREIYLPFLPSTGTILHEATVHLTEPLGGRLLIAAASGMRVPLQ
jgi:hypothetical protein